MILNFKDENTWKPIIHKSLNDILGDSHTAIVAKNAAKIKYRDSIEEACELFTDIISKTELIEILMHEVTKNFKEVTVYHACRTDNVNDYYEKGIIPLSQQEAQSKFREIFSAYAPEEAINKAICSVSTNTRDGVVYTVLDDRVFIERSGHYLIYGGEYLHCLAVHLPATDKEFMRDLLKKIGKATVLVCSLPFSIISDLECLVRYMMADHFFRIAHERDEVYVIDYTVFSTQKISPEKIIRHYHPVKIIDQFKHQAVWNEAIMDYE